jgi:hypothetical protein
MKIIAVYNEQLREYVQRVVSSLQLEGYAVEMTSIDDYTGNQAIASIPTFFIRKDDKDSYAYRGKAPVSVILEWAKNSGAKDN